MIHLWSCSYLCSAEKRRHSYFGEQNDRVTFGLPDSLSRLTERLDPSFQNRHHLKEHILFEGYLVPAPLSPVQALSGIKGELGLEDYLRFLLSPYSLHYPLHHFSPTYALADMPDVNCMETIAYQEELEIWTEMVTKVDRWIQTTSTGGRPVPPLAQAVRTWLTEHEPTPGTRWTGTDRTTAKNWNGTVDAMSGSAEN